MLVNQNETQAVVRQIVFKLTIDRSLREDLTQEAFVHLWLREQQCPGQTPSWYLQSCRFFLQNYLRHGRSVDSTKHHKALRSSAESNESSETSATEPASAGSVLALVSAREITSLLAKWLTPLERQLLRHLTEGFSVREIADRLNLSHTSVIRCRRRIASLALKLGIEPLPNTNGRRMVPGQASASHGGTRVSA
jgi:RNA polymerase sigma factor (sigma-70 family)